MVSTHLKNISQIRSPPQVRVKIKKCLKPPPIGIYYQLTTPLGKMWPFQKTSNGNIPTTEGGRDQHEVPRSLFAGTTRLRSQVACFLTKIHDKNHSSPPFTSSKNREVLAAPGKINIEPDNTSLEKEKHLNQTIIFRFYVNLGGCTSSKGPFSIAMLVYQRGYLKWRNPHLCVSCMDTDYGKGKTHPKKIAGY